jgi:ABC-type polysaccharide/polyol phosphate transport system ATPase subunit
MAKIELKNISVEFPVYNVSSRSFKKKFLRLATGGHVSKDSKEHVIVRSLDNITLSLKHGDRVGLIGHNGAGKSTLLKLLAGIYEATSGNAYIDGHISSLLNIMQGIESEFTGYENILIRGITLGLSSKQIKVQINKIADLTGLGDYLTMPVRTYSSGMMVRLAFAISTSINPDILLIDEVFGAGDSEFMITARETMLSLLNQASIVVLASHDNNLIKEFCNKSVLLDSGQVKFFGPTEQTLDQYQQLLTRNTV